ncbi:hypothetical protein Bp8pS_235 [Bacillus phage vB_BpuM-BpSp]|nr:hypothetical protein Bp8pS_235 [Bacillus phage vB_BpuM-BpSp]
MTNDDKKFLDCLNKYNEFIDCSPNLHDILINNEISENLLDEYSKFFDYKTWKVISLTQKFSKKFMKKHQEFIYFNDMLEFNEKINLDLDTVSEFKEYFAGLLILKKFQSREAINILFPNTDSIYELFHRLVGRYSRSLFDVYPDIVNDNEFVEFQLYSFKKNSTHSIEYSKKFFSLIKINKEMYIRYPELLNRYSNVILESPNVDNEVKVLLKLHSI